MSQTEDGVEFKQPRGGRGGQVEGGGRGGEEVRFEGWRRRGLLAELLNPDCVSIAPLRSGRRAGQSRAERS